MSGPDIEDRLIATGEIPTDGVQPIRPDEVEALRVSRLGTVIPVFNDLIAQHLTPGYGASFSEAEARKRLIAAGLDPREIIARDLLNVGFYYEAAGWKVERDNDQRDPGSPVMFTFRPKPEPFTPSG